MAEKKKFTTLNREEVVFEVDGVDHVLKQASGAASRKYREASLTGTEMDYDNSDEDSKRVTMRKIQGLAGVESLLVSECCYREGKLVSRDTIEGWPGEIQKWAFAEIKRISPWLDEKDDEGVESLKKQRDKLSARIAKLEQTDPKA